MLERSEAGIADQLLSLSRKRSKTRKSRLAQPRANPQPSLSLSRKLLLSFHGRVRSVLFHPVWPAGLINLSRSLRSRTHVDVQEEPRRHQSLDQLGDHLLRILNVSVLLKVVHRLWTEWVADNLRFFLEW